MSLESRATTSEAGLNLTLWAGCLAGPIAWFLQLEAVYALASGYCGGKGRLGLHLVSLVCLLLAAGGSWASWKGWGTVGHAWPSESEGGTAGRARFMGALGLMSCLFCALVILAQWIAIVVLDPCPL
jgi:hypothetical protein